MKKWLLLLVSLSLALSSCATSNDEKKEPDKNRYRKVQPQVNNRALFDKSTTPSSAVIPASEKKLIQAQQVARKEKAIPVQTIKVNQQDEVLRKTVPDQQIARTQQPENTGQGEGNQQQQAVVAATTEKTDLIPRLSAFELLLMAAEQGDILSQYYLATRYREGKGIGQNHAEALIWYKKAATQGYAPAQHDLGVMYERGLGTKQDAAEAKRWYDMAAGTVLETETWLKTDKLASTDVECTPEQEKLRYRYMEILQWMYQQGMWAAPLTKNHHTR